MTFIFRNRTIFWDISKWNREQKKWDRWSIIFFNTIGKKSHCQTQGILSFDSKMCVINAYPNGL